MPSRAILRSPSTILASNLAVATRVIVDMTHEAHQATVTAPTIVVSE